MNTHNDKKYYVCLIDDHWKDELTATIPLFKLDENNSVLISVITNDMSNDVVFEFLFEEYTEKAENKCKYIDFNDYNGNPVDVSAILLDVKFDNEDDQKAGLRLLDKIYYMDPSLPVIIITQDTNIQDAYESGMKRAKGYWDKVKIRKSGPKRENFLKFLYDQIEIAKKENIYDQDHKETANRLAIEYDKKESEYPGTVAYWYFENELILNIIKDVIKRKQGLGQDNSISVIDIGCGTGRIAKLLTKTDHFKNRHLKITNLDFSGRMLKQLKDKISQFGITEDDHFKIIRAVAERLPLGDKEYDLVIMGFGFPSYTKYYDTLKEAFRICKLGGECIISVYNEDSILYENIKYEKIKKCDSLIAAIPHRQNGKLFIAGDYEVDCEVFSHNSIRKILSRVGFFDVINSWSFPTLYTSLGGEELEKMADCGKENEFGCNKFSKILLNFDKNLSNQLKNKGHYLVLHVKKPEGL